MRIVFMAYDRKGYNGGPIINVRRILPALQSRGHVVCALIPFLDGEAPNVAFLKESGITCKSISFPEYSEDLVRWILKEVKAFQPDIFIPNISHQGGYAARWIREAGIPTVIAHRSDDAQNWCLVKTFVTGKKKWRVNGLMCVSEYLRNEASKLIKYPVETAVIPSGVPKSPFIASQTGETLKVVYAGRLEQRQKRIWETLRTFIAIAKNNDNTEFTFIGEGAERVAMQHKVAQQGLKNKITFTRKLNDEAYHQELSKHHIIVLMSDYEGIPGSLIDGMMCGLVPVCLRITGIEELIKHRQTGFLLNSRAELEKLVDTLHSEEIRKSIGKNALAHVHHHFSLESCVDRWEAFCYKLVDNNQKKQVIKMPRRLNLPAATLPYEGAKRKNRTLYNIAKSIIKNFLKKGVKSSTKVDMIHDNFINIPLSRENLDRYYHRASILNALNKSLPHLSGRLLDAGCGQMPYRSHILNRSAVTEYVGLDIETAKNYSDTVKPDATWDGKTMPFGDESFHCAFATEVLEHVPEPINFLSEIYRTLKTDGVFFFTVPFVWPLHETPHDEYRYTPYALERMLQKAGFSNIVLTPLGGWHASMAQMIGLWVKRSPLSTNKRKVLAYLLFPFYKYLLKKDQKIIGEGQMITGVSGIAYKQKD